MTRGKYDSNRAGSGYRGRGDSWAPGRKPGSRKAADYDDDDYDDFPQLYDTEINRLYGRTMRAYNLVINYEKDCPAGHRWASEHINEIREAGKHLEGDRARLSTLCKNHLRRSSSELKNQIRWNALELRNYCKEVQDLIREYEQKVLVDDDVIEVDKHGHPVGFQIRGAAAKAESMEGVEYGSDTDTDMHSVQSTDGGRGRRERAPGPGYGPSGYEADTWRRNRDGSPA